MKTLFVAHNAHIHALETTRCNASSPCFTNVKKIPPFLLFGLMLQTEKKLALPEIVQKQSRDHTPVCKLNPKQSHCYSPRTTHSDIIVLFMAVLLRPLTLFQKSINNV